ncbi:hypothetical protein [Paucibacter sp. XJ19-41]|uniref:hypothetical protein n=1 Tax=Paucibacter sp. XJ19-41 TaxID=2927824 RepID=UPI002349F9E0|nr:hypothetical protein [Paucibacter sp. XJ19-41]MDC6171352.1 hypothetical protein [Paucibacter sp. XJ19-41]
MSPERPRQRDVNALFAELRAANEECFDALRQTPSERVAQAQRQLLLALQLSWRLEELVLLPALRRSGLNTAEIEQEMLVLREAADMLASDALDASAAHIVLGAIEGIAMLRAKRIGAALASATQAGPLDNARLADEFQQMLERWRGELRGDLQSPPGSRPH